jgi:hypothetical protein
MAKVNCRQCFSFRDGEKPVCSNPKSGVGFLDHRDWAIDHGGCPLFAPRDNMIDDEGTIVFSSMPVAPVAGDWSSTAAATAEANARGEGYKADGGKPRWTLLPLDALEDAVRVLTLGATKYAPGNWMHVPDGKTRYLDAAFRHLSARALGEVADPETGLPHLSHAICCCLFAAWFDKHEAPQP